jgi:hypothetical protein
MLTRGRRGIIMTEKEIEKLADKVWKEIASAYHWGDGFTDAYNSLHTALRTVAGKRRIKNGR